jgi:hypothetical protein
MSVLKGVFKAMMLCAYLYINRGLRFGQVPQVVCECKQGLGTAEYQGDVKTGIRRNQVKGVGTFKS